MRVWRLTVHGKTGQCSVELKAEEEATWKPWRYMGRVASLEEAERLIREGWPDADGVQVFPVFGPYLLETLRQVEP